MLLDHSHTKVVLIGNSVYPNWELGKIPNIDVNLKELKDVLFNPEFIGVKDDPDSAVVLKNEGKTKIQVELNKMIKKCTPDDTLIIYYAGHGLLDMDDITKLYMSTNDTDIDDKVSTCLNSDELKGPLIKCRARNKIMILDCCYAAKLVKGGLQSDIGSIRTSHWSSTEGVYFLMSSDVDTPSRFDPDDDKIPTFFTQKMVNTIRDGGNQGQEIWTLDEFFESMKSNWDTQKAPTPLKLTLSTIGNLPFCYNRFRFSKNALNVNVLDDEEKLFNEIEMDPTDERLKDFINNSKRADLRKRALRLWSKMKDEYELLKKALEANSFEALSKFIDEVDPVKPVRKIATEKMISFSVENRNRSISKSDIGLRAGSKGLGSIASHASKLKKK